MRPTVFKYGAIAGGLLVLLMITPTLFMDMNDPTMYQTHEVIGYISMFLSLCVIFVGMRKFRESAGGGEMTFARGFLVGALIAIVAGVIFGFFSWLTYAYIVPDFSNKYFEHAVIQVKQSGLPAAEIAAKIKEMNSQKELFTNPFFGGFLMFATVAPMGFVIAFISALILKTKKKA